MKVNFKNIDFRNPAIVLGTFLLLGILLGFIVYFVITPSTKEQEQINSNVKTFVIKHDLKSVNCRENMTCGGGGNYCSFLTDDDKINHFCCTESMCFFP